jgi:phage shock protein C
MQSQARLTRPINDRMIAGVCSGLAQYLNVDVTIVRLVFVLALFFSGVGPLVYIALWIVMPEATSIPQPPSQLPTPINDPTGEWQYDPYTGQPIRRNDQNT